MEKLKVVSIGGAGHVVLVLDDMMGMDEAELVAFSPAVEGENLDLVTNHRIYNDRIQHFGNYQDMLDQIKPDVAIVSTRLDKIPEASIEAANAGCHLICEKPLALDYATLKRIYQAVNDNNVQLTAMLSMRSLPVFIAARNAYRNGDIGPVVLVNGRKSYKWLEPPDWFACRETYGGTIGWVGIHAFDFINYITGEKFTSVAAMQSNFAHKDYRDCEDNCVLLFEMSNGGHGTISVDYFRPVTASTHGDDRVRIVGTKGIIEANAGKKFCHLLVEGKDQIDIPLPEPSKMFRNFLLNLLGKAKYEAKPSDSFMLTYVCLCTRDAADNRNVVNIKQGIWS